MSMPLKHIITAIFGLGVGAVLLFTAWADDIPPPPPFDQYIKIFGVFLIIAGVIGGARGILTEKRINVETARLRGEYPELADVPVERLKKHLLFIGYYRQTPDPFPVRVNFDGRDAELERKRRDDLAHFNRVLDHFADLDAEEKRMCRMRYIAEELLS